MSQAAARSTIRGVSTIRSGGLMKRVAFTAAVGSGPPGGGPEIGMNTRPPNGEGGKMLVPNA